MNKATQVLPEGYAQSGQMDLKKDKRLTILLNLGALMVFALSFYLLSALTARVRPEIMTFSTTITVTNILSALGLTILTLLLHEAIHGLFFWIFSHTRPVFGLRPLYAYAGAPNWFFPQRQFAITALAPLVILGAAGLLLLLLAPIHWIFMIVLLVALNTSGASGDVFVFIRLLKSFPNQFYERHRGSRDFLRTSSLGMSRPNLLRRLLYLRNLEFFNIFWLPVCLSVALKAREIQAWQPFGYGMFVICVILGQGVFYWHLKLQTLSKTGITFPAYFYALFSFFKWADVILLFIYPLLIFGSQITPLVNFHASIWANLLFLFAVLEYTNYYHYQLSHDNLNDLRYLVKYRKIRRSPLFMDLQRNQKRGWQPTAG